MLSPGDGAVPTSKWESGLFLSESVHIKIVSNEAT